MACNCNKDFNPNIKLNKVDNSTNIKPFDSCLLCALKHLGYAQILFQLNKYRTIGLIYLAYKHLEELYQDLSIDIFELLNDFINFKYLKNKLFDLTLKIQNKLNINPLKKLKLNLLKKLKDYQKSIIYICAANLLFNYLVGYKDVNTPFVIGLLQKACLSVDLNYKLIVRNMWKNILSENKLNENDIIGLCSFLVKKWLKDNSYIA